MGKKKIIFVFSILLLGLFVTGSVLITYSEYIGQSANANSIGIAKWTVKVNETDVVKSTTFDLDDSYITWSDSDKIADGYVAPGRTGIMTIKLDTTGSEVAVKYTLSVDTTFFDSYDQINVTKINNQAVTDGIYTGIIALTDVDVPIDIPIEFTWENSGSNNSSDTYIASTIDNLSIPVSLTVEQYTGI